MTRERLIRAGKAVLRRRRSLAVSDHVVDRVSERAGASHLDPEHVRQIVAGAVLAGAHHPWREGQTIVMVRVLGRELWAVIGEDTTGWGDGRAVITVLTPEQRAKGPGGGAS